MPGGNLRIGATVDVAELQAGMADGVEAIRAAAQNIAASFEEVKGRTKAAWAGLGEDVKAGAAQITQAQLDVAQATKAHAAALADLRRVYTISKGDTVSEAQGLALLASAQTKVAESSAALTAAKEAEAGTLVASNESEQLSENALVATFQRANMAIGESLAGLKERFYLTATGAHISARDIASSFSGLGELLGAGLFAEMAGSYLEDSVKLQIGLKHLSEETGIAIGNLAGLQVIAKSMRVEWDPVERAVQRFGRALEEGTYKQVEYKRALDAIGVSLADLDGKTAEEQLNILAGGFRRTTQEMKLTYAAQELFGRGGVAMIPILRAYGDGLSDASKHQGDLAGITDRSSDAAMVWQAAVTRIAVNLHRLVIPAIEGTEDVIFGLAGLWHALLGVFEVPGAILADPFVIATRAAEGFGRVMKDLADHNWAAMRSDAEATSESLKKTFSESIAEIGHQFAMAKHEWTVMPKLREAPPFTPSDTTESTTPGRGGRSAALKADEQDLAQARLDAAQHGYALGLSGEIDFWKHRLAAAKSGSDEYKAIVGKLATLEDEQARRKTKASPMGQMEVVTPDLSAAITQTIDQMRQAQTRSAQQLSRDSVAAVREGIDEQIRLAEQGVAEKRRLLEEEVAAGQVSLREELKQLMDASNQAYAIELAQVRMKEAIDAGSRRAYQMDLNQETNLTRQWAKQIIEIQRQAAQQTARTWQQSWQLVTQQLNASVAQWTVMGRGFEQSWAQFMGGLTANFVQNLAKMMEQEILAAVLHKSLLKQDIIGEAKTAGAAGFKWGMQYGGPAAPVLAPIAAATAVAATLAFDSFADGGVVRGAGSAHVPILAHAGERVLSPSQTQNFETLVSNRTSSSASSVNLGGVTQNFHNPRSTPREMQSAIKQLARRGMLRMR